MAHSIDDDADQDLERAIAMSLAQSNPVINISDDDSEADEDLKRALAMSLEVSGSAHMDSMSATSKNGDGKAFKPSVPAPIKV
jgi:hypothetical protein